MKKKLLFVILVVACTSAFVPHGVGWIEASPLGMSEAFAAQCDDLIDNDGDGGIDYGPFASNDRDCWYAGDSEFPKPACSDQRDNDGDSKIDFGDSWVNDPECSSATDNDEGGSAPPPPSTTACSNGSDDDVDGQSDYPNDPGCSSSSDTSEKGTIVCDDGISNDDGDSLIDYRTDGTGDPGCYGPSDTDEGNVAQCSDGVDNGIDGKVDTGNVMNYSTGTYYPADPDCASPWDTTENDTDYAAPPPAETYALYSEGFEGDACQVDQPCLRPAKDYVCVHQGYSPSYFLYDENNPSLGANVFGSSRVKCNRPVKSIRLIVTLHRNTYTGSPTFVVKAGPNYTLQMETTSAENWVTYSCAFWGSGIHSRTWYLRSQAQIIWPDGSISTSDKRTPRVTLMCH